MSKGMNFLYGIGLGAGFMYFFDPDRGNRRRALLRDKAVHAMNETTHCLDATVHDIQNRSSGWLAELSHLLKPDHASDAVIRERIRARLGRVVSHPRSVQVTVHQNRAVISGHILTHEAESLLAAISSVRGVQSVEDRLERHPSAGNFPGLQGEGRTPRIVPDYLQASWSPTTRAAACIAGGILALYGARHKHSLGTMSLGMAGLSLLTRGVTNRDLKRLTGVGHGNANIEIVKTININAPVDLVFAFWSNYDNFPHFMSNVETVRESGNGHSHWVVKGPAGIPIEWDADVTRIELNRELSWKSLPGGVVDNSGRILFEDVGDNTTRVDIRLSYSPPAGAIGHTVADLLGFDPKAKMDRDLARMKTLIETGRPPHDAAQPNPLEA